MERRTCLFGKDENRSVSRKIEFGYHFLLYFNLNSNIDMNIFKYKYEMDVLDSDFYSNIYSIQLKVHTVKLNSRYMNNLQYQSEINYNR